MRQERMGTLFLVGATVIVGLSIVLDGALAKALNGMGGLAWFVAAALLVRAAWRYSRSLHQWLAVLLLTSLVAFIIRPSDLVVAMVGFGIAGLVIVWLAPSHEVTWANLIVALYLPVHIGAAILKTVIRSLVGAEATLRTDPPPTAAVVPFVMVVACMGGGVIARQIVQRRQRLARDLLARNP